MYTNILNNFLHKTRTPCGASHCNVKGVDIYVEDVRLFDTLRWRVCVQVFKVCGPTPCKLVC